MDSEHMNDFEDEEVDLDSDEAEYLEMIESWEDDEEDGDESIPELYFSRPDPYAKPDPLPTISPAATIALMNRGALLSRTRAHGGFRK